MAELTSLQIRKLADTSEGTRVLGFDPFTGEKRLINPETGAPEPWPLLGVEIVGDAPERTHVPTGWVQKGAAEGWLVLENPQPVHRPGGPPEDLWRLTHTFVHADAIIIRTLDGDVRYKVTKQPDKYADDSTVEDGGRKLEDGLKFTPNTLDPDTEVTGDLYAAGQTRIDWFYELELDNA